MSLILLFSICTMKIGSDFLYVLDTLSWKKNILHISHTIIFSPFLFHFYIFCLDQRLIRETKTGLAWVLNCRTNAGHGF